MRKPGAEEVASGLEAETGNTQGSSSAESEVEVVGGNEIGQGEECVKEGEGAGEAAVGQGNLIGREDIRHVSDKMVVEAHGGEALSKEFREEEDECERAGCMKVGWGGHVGIEAEAGRLGVRLGRHSRSGHGDLEAKKDDRGGQI